MEEIQVNYKLPESKSFEKTSVWFTFESNEEDNQRLKRPNGVEDRLQSFVEKGRIVVSCCDDNFKGGDVECKETDYLEVFQRNEQEILSEKVKKLEILVQKLNQKLEDLLFDKKLKEIDVDEYSIQYEAWDLLDIVRLLLHCRKKSKEMKYLKRIEDFLRHRIETLRFIILQDMYGDLDMKSLKDIQNYLHNKLETSVHINPILNSLILLFQDEPLQNFDGLTGLLLLIAFIKSNFKGSFENCCLEHLKLGWYSRYDLFRKDRDDKLIFTQVFKVIDEKEMKIFLKNLKEKIGLVAGAYWIIKRKFKSFPNSFVKIYTKEMNYPKIEEIIIQETIHFPLSISFEFL